MTDWLRDPHYRLGAEHAYEGEERYVWSDPELQRRYEKGYQDAIDAGVASPHREHPRRGYDRAEVRRQLEELMRRQREKTPHRWD